MGGADLTTKDEDFVTAAGGGMADTWGRGGGPPDDRGHPLHAVGVQDCHSIQQMLPSLTSAGKTQFTHTLFLNLQTIITDSA